MGIAISLFDEYGFSTKLDYNVLNVTNKYNGVIDTLSIMYRMQYHIVLNLDLINTGFYQVESHDSLQKIGKLHFNLTKIKSIEEYLKERVDDELIQSKTKLLLETKDLLKRCKNIYVEFNADVEDVEEENKLFFEKFFAIFIKIGLFI